ncbi:MAG: 3'(2'),5'-bisphosphate nucleotidase CysQ [Rhodothermales bacterium]
MEPTTDQNMEQTDPAFDLGALLQRIEELAWQAGKEAMCYYDMPHEGVETKADNSPLTLADTAVHRFLVSELRVLTPELPVLSEESEEKEYEGRRDWNTFWLIDPLDGTKEFIKRSDEFTVNIALVRGEEPILGVVHAPALEAAWSGAEGVGSFMTRQGARVPIQVRAARAEALTVVASRDHAGPQVEQMMSANPSMALTSMGSSLKFCLVAEGRADLYPRLSPTMEWDTAAAQAVVEAAGGRVVTPQGERLRYNKADLRNEAFIVVGDTDLNWEKRFGISTTP